MVWSFAPNATAAAAAAPVHISSPTPIPTPAQPALSLPTVGGVHLQMGDAQAGSTSASAASQGTQGVADVSSGGRGPGWAPTLVRRR